MFSPPRDHHVLAAPDNATEALSVERGQIARVHPAVGVQHVGGPGLVGPISEHDGVAASADLADRAERDDLAAGVDELDLQVGLNAANGGYSELQEDRRGDSGS